MILAYPLSWPQGWGRATSRKSAKFSTGSRQHAADGQSSWMTHKALTITEATKRVLTELERLGVPHGEAIISSNLMLRLDGLPRSGQGEPSDPGVAVYWRRPRETMRVMAIDRYDRTADNLAAIAADPDLIARLRECAEKYATHVSTPMLGKTIEGRANAQNANLAELFEAAADLAESLTAAMSRIRADTWDEAIKVVEGRAQIHAASAQRHRNKPCRDRVDENDYERMAMSCDRSKDALKEVAGTFRALAIAKEKT